jgi:hypothetical protein
MFGDELEKAKERQGMCHSHYSKMTNKFLGDNTMYNHHHIPISVFIFSLYNNITFISIVTASIF